MHKHEIKDSKKENTTKNINHINLNSHKKRTNSLEKARKKLEFLSHLKITKKHNTTKKTYEKCIIGYLLNNASCHLVAIFKEKMLSDYVDEFLRREYLLQESKERIPKFSLYYKNYLLFFCKPTFNNFSFNEIINDYGEKKAELYYKNNYQGGKTQNEEDNGFEESDSEDNESESEFKKNDNGEIFNNSIKENIDNVTIMTTINTSGNSTINLNLNNEKIEVFSENKCEISNDTTVHDLMDIVKKGQELSIIKKRTAEKNKNKNKNSRNKDKGNINSTDERMTSKIKKSNSKGDGKKKGRGKNIIEFKKAMLSKGVHKYKKHSNNSMKKNMDKNSKLDMNKKLTESNKISMDKLSKLFKKNSSNLNAYNYNNSRNKYYYKNINYYSRNVNNYINTGIMSTDSNNVINTSNNTNNKFNYCSNKNLKFTHHTQEGVQNKKSKKKIINNNFSANLKNCSISKEKETEKKNVSSHANLINNSNNNNNNNFNQCSIKSSLGNISNNITSHNHKYQNKSRSRNNKGFLYKQNTACTIGKVTNKGYGYNIYNTTSLHKIYKSKNSNNHINNNAYFGNNTFKTLNFAQNNVNTNTHHQRTNTAYIKSNTDDNKLFNKYSNVSQDNRSSLKILTTDLGHMKYTKPVIKLQNEKIIKVNKISPENVKIYNNENNSNNNSNKVMLGAGHKITKSSGNIKIATGINPYNNINKKHNNKNCNFRNHQHYTNIANNINSNDSSNKNRFTESNGDLVQLPLSLLLEGNSTCSNNNTNCNYNNNLTKKNASNSKNQKKTKPNKYCSNNSQQKSKYRNINTNYNININNQININTNTNTGGKNLKDYLNMKIKQNDIRLSNLRQGINCINLRGGVYITGSNLNLHNLKNNVNRNKKSRGRNVNSGLKNGNLETNGNNNTNGKNEDNIIKSYHTKSVSSLTDLINQNKNLISLYKNISKSISNEQK